MKSHIISIISILFIFFLLFTSMNILTVKGGEKDELLITIRNITNDNITQLDPKIFRDILIWEDHSKKDDIDIMGYNLSINEMKILTTGAGDQKRAEIYGNRVVWVDHRAQMNGGIYGYNLTNNKEEKFLSGDSIGIEYPSLYEDNVASEYYSDETGFDIKLYNLSSGEEMSICTANGTQDGPLIWGDYIVWNDKRDGNIDVYGYDLIKKEEFLIAGGPDNQILTSFWGSYVMYHDNGTLNENYYLYNISQRQIDRKLPDGIHFDLVWGDYIVGSNTYLQEFYVYEISTNHSFIHGNIDVICDSIYMNKVVWSDQRNPSDIWYLEFSIVNNNSTNGDDDKDHNNLSIPSATMSFLVMSIILIAIIRRKN